MASVEVSTAAGERHNKRRPFAMLMKRLTNLKSSDQQASKKSSNHFSLKKGSNGKPRHSPYPESAPTPQQRLDDEGSVNGNLSYSTRQSRPASGSVPSIPLSDSGSPNVAASHKSNAPTVATNPDTVHSDTGQSRALTTKTTGGVSSVDGGAVGSTFSSPNPSEHSLTTTLTTVQSASPGLVLSGGGHAATPTGPERSVSGTTQVQFSHQFPPTGVVSAIPPHMTPNPTTYNTATANNLLSDDASILTLASSSKRRRRRSMDTDASVRALAPSSLWGGSRESLPLSILGGTAENPSHPMGRPLPTERNSVYSSSGVGAPALLSDRNSYYATSVKQSIRERDKDTIDGKSLYDDQKSLHGSRSLHDGRNYEGSIRSGRAGHYRSDSNAGSVNAALISPGVAAAAARHAPETSSRRSSAYHADSHDHDGIEEEADHVNDDTKQRS